MTIGIYQSYWGWIGGGGLVIGTVAEALARQYDVELVHHREDFCRQSVEDALHLDLSRVRFRWVPEVARQAPRELNPFRRYREERDWCAHLSRGYDLFINSSEMVPVFCHAPRGVLFTWFPFMDADDFHGRRTPEWHRRPAWMRPVLRLYHQVEWQRRYHTYQLFLTCSEFSRLWLKRRWGVQARVLYPPVRSDWQPRAKEKLVLSVARFQANVTGNHKKHAALIEAFKALGAGALQGWCYVIVGGLRETPENLAYLRSLQDLARGHAITLKANVSGPELKDLYQRASLFWHATGYGEDPVQTPDRMEHFGIVTVEALAAGCVPVVFRGGGQPEIVRHGREGFLWDRVEELQAHSAQMSADPALLRELAVAGRQRAQQFSREEFVRRLFAALQPVLG